MKVLVLGANGKLGRAVCASLRAQGHEAVAVGSPNANTPHTLDITDYAAVRQLITTSGVACVVNCAGWTDVDGCARNPERALHVNGVGAHHVAAAAAEAGIAVLYVSTNEVFNGEQTAPYYEYDTPHPINPYGASKLYGERAVISVNPRHYIVRTSWLFAHGGRNFIHSILNAARAAKPLRVVIDEVANPTYNDDLAHAIVQLIQTGRYGSYHLVNEGGASRYTFARFVLDNMGFAHLPITPISRHEWERASTPPAHAVLANMAGAAVGVRLRDWREGVQAFLENERRENERQPS